MLSLPTESLHEIEFGWSSGDATSHYYGRILQTVDSTYVSYCGWRDIH